MNGWIYKWQYDNATGHSVTIATTNSNHIILDAGAGNVGVGTTEPDTKLHINNSTATSTLYMESGGAGTGGRIITEDTDGAGCTQEWTLDGLKFYEIIACP